MASLNTLRTKGGWFLSGIIVLALLAFILGDAFSGQRSNNPVVGTIDGEKVRYSEFVSENARQDAMMQNQDEESREQAYQRAWSEMINRNVFVPGFGTLGLGLSEAEQADMVSGTGGGYLSPVIEQYFRSPQTGAFDQQMLAYFVSNMTASDRATWDMVLRQASDERLFSKYSALVANGLYTNDLEVSQATEAEGRTYDARVIFKPYSSIADSMVNIPQSELKAYYRAHKNNFKRAAGRDIEYVVFDILPSDADMTEGENRANELAQQFAAAGDAAAFALANSDDKTPATFVPEAEIDPAVLAGEVLGPVREGETFTMSRLIERRSVPDSVSFGAIILSGDQSTLADSLMGVVNAENFTTLASAHSEDRQSEMAGGATVSLDPTTLMPELSTVLLNTPSGQIARAESGGYIFIVDVQGKTAPLAKARVATVKYTVRASAATHAEATNKAREFYTKAATSREAFDKAVSEMALSKRTAHIAGTAREVEGLENSLGLVRWAFNAKKNAVMEPEELTRDYIVVAALTGATEAGITPFEDAQTQIRSLLVQRKKGDALAETMTGASLDAIAQSQKLDITATQGLKFSAFAIPELGFEPRLVGAICSSKEINKVSKPVRGTSGVYVFEVTSIVTEDNATAEDTRVRLESMREYMMNSSLMNALYEKSNVVDNRAKFF